MRRPPFYGLFKEKRVGLLEERVRHVGIDQQLGGFEFQIHAGPEGYHHRMGEQNTIYRTVVAVRNGSSLGMDMATRKPVVVEK